MVYDSYLELPKEKQPPDDIIDKPEEVDKWFDKVFNRKETDPETVSVNLYEIEG